MSNKHKYYDVIVAWASGEKIQYNFENCGWNDFTFREVPGFNNENTEWRIKPKTVTKRYRMALVRDGSSITKTEVRTIDITDSCLDDPIEYNITGFIRWVGDAAEVEVEV